MHQNGVYKQVGPRRTHRGALGSGRSLRSLFVFLASVRDCSARRQSINFHRVGLEQDITGRQITS